MENLEIIIVLLTLTTFLAVISDKTRLPFPILLISVGVAAGAVPWIPPIVLKPEIVFLIFLPPLLYYSAWGLPWRDFQANLRPITLAGVGLVFFTTAIVAWAAHTYVPGLGWPEAFVLGAIVSPPDAVAAASATKGLGLHRRIVTILEGESLINDASGLIAYKYAIAVVLTGTFSLWQAGLQFLWVASAGVAVGLGLGYVMAWIHKNFVEGPQEETTLSFLTAYFAYLIAENLHVSGVLAVVACGLYMSFRSQEVFTTQSRLQSRSVWDTINFILNSVVFILIGLQLRSILTSLGNSYSAGELWWYGLVVSLATIAARFVWVYPTAYLPRLFKGVRQREYFRHANVVVFCWAGMRGVVSMAAAFALPLTVSSGQPFPHRDLILFLTFCVIFFTLVAQGLTLPWLIKLLGIQPHTSHEEEAKVRLELAYGSIAHIEDNLSYGVMSQPVLDQLKHKYEIKVNRLRALQNPALTNPDAPKAEGPDPIEIFNQFIAVQVEMIRVEREMLHHLRRQRQADEEVIRKLEGELDMEEARLSPHLPGA
jgi:monovalent cation/hydrogen antiporter